MLVLKYVWSTKGVQERMPFLLRMHSEEERVGHHHKIQPLLPQQLHNAPHRGTQLRVLLSRRMKVGIDWRCHFDAERGILIGGIFKLR